MPNMTDHNDDAAPSKNLIQKLINKETMPTAYAAISAFAWIGGFLDISKIAHFLYASFDGFIDRISETIVCIIPLYLHIHSAQIKILILYSSVFVFFISGILSLRKDKLGILKDDQDAYLSVASLGLIFFLFGIKYEAIQNGNHISQELHAIPISGIMLWVFCASALPCIVFMLIRAVGFGRLKSYLCTIGAFILIYYALLYFIGMGGGYGIREFLKIVVYGSLFVIPFIMLSANPKRLRQITLFGIVFFGLSLCSVVFENIHVNV